MGRESSFSLIRQAVDSVHGVKAGKATLCAFVAPFSAQPTDRSAICLSGDKHLSSNNIFR